MTLPPLPAIGSIQVEIYGALPGSAKWDEALWDGETSWAIFGFIDITPQSVTAQISWGADDPIGVLTHPASGSFVVNTYDPNRVLDPSNGTSPNAGSIRPGRPIRLSYTHSVLGHRIIRNGIIDEVEYDLSEKRGVLRGTDFVQLMVGATMAAGQTGVPTTLRARAQHFVTKAGLNKLITIEATPAGETDPICGPVIATEASVWDHILSGALDTLYAVWMGRYGMLRFRSFGNPLDNGVSIGGADGIPISTMKTQGSLQGVYTRVTAFASAAPTVPVSVVDNPKLELYGDIPYKRDTPVADAASWVASVLADRSGAALQYMPGTLYPRTEDELESLLELGMIDIVHMAVDSSTPPLDVSARVLGGTLTADTGTGYTAGVLAYIPANEWEEAEQPEPPEPPIPPIPPATTTSVRTYNCTEDTRLVKSGGSNYGNGTDTTIPIGEIGGTRNRAILDFETASWSGVVEVTKAELLLTTGSESCGAFGSNPKVTALRITSGWSEGSYSGSCAFGTGNASVYPGPNTTSTGSVSETVPNASGNDYSIDITAIAKAWFGGQTQHGVMLRSAGEDAGKYTTSIYTRHHGTAANRPKLKLTLKVKV